MQRSLALCILPKGNVRGKGMCVMSRWMRHPCPRSEDGTYRPYEGKHKSMFLLCIELIVYFASLLRKALSCLAVLFWLLALSINTLHLW